MINDLNVPDVDLWKYVDDMTISECVPRDQPRSIQSAVDYLARCAAEFQLNESKCKELRISFSLGNSDQILPIIINNKPIKSVGSATILGLHVSCDLKWNVHVDEVIKKARKHLYCLVQPKRSGLEPREPTQFFCTCIRPILEYSCPVYHNSLPAFLSHDLEAIQKRAMRIIYSPCSYQQALVMAELPLLKIVDKN